MRQRREVARSECLDGLFHRCRGLDLGIFQRAGGSADRGGVGDADDPDLRPIDLGEGFDPGSTGDHIGALDQAIVRAEVDALLAFVVNRHEGYIDRAGFQCVGHQARIGHDQELRSNAKLLRELTGEVDGDAARPAILILDGEEGGRRRRVNDAGSELSGGSEFFHCCCLGVGAGHVGIASVSKAHCGSGIARDLKGFTRGPLGLWCINVVASPSYLMKIDASANNVSNFAQT